MCLLDFSKEFELKPFQDYQKVQIFVCQIAVVSSTLIIGTQDSLYSEKFNQTESTIYQNMEKHQKLSSYQLDDLPDEVILKMLGFLDIKDLLLCGQVSMRLRTIANDESLWLKLNLYSRRWRDIPYEFIEKAVENGCQYLNLYQ